LTPAARRLVLILGDQLHPCSPLVEELDPSLDRLLMIEASGEALAGGARSHRARVALFLSAMRHHAQALRPLDYLALDDEPVAGSALVDRLRTAIERRRPESLRYMRPGDWRLGQSIAALCRSLDLPAECIDDPHFLCTPTAFGAWARGQKTLRMEFFYRRMRVEHGVLMNADGTPEGGRWNFDIENRKGFPTVGPGKVPARVGFEPDAITRQVLALVAGRFPDHPGELDGFAWPVTRADALVALERFIAERLPDFGRWQDAMWSDMPFGWHSLLSTSLNLKLLDPREVIEAAVQAWRRGEAPIESVEGFVRQVLGWREFIRGVYELEMPGLASANHFGHERPLPAWFWTGDTQMACLRACVGQTLRHAYAHHIQRLMVVGNFATLAELAPSELADWFLAVYADAVEWVELPNVAGMALHAAGGRFTSKPYVAGGAYIDRMSNYCSGCRYRPTERTGPRACPFTVLYWRFVDRHAQTLAANPRTALMARGVERFGNEGRAAIRALGDRMLGDIERL
jgi:deoxyribodipyrimidine photolyase-related protein